MSNSEPKIIICDNIEISNVLREQLSPGTEIIVLSAQEAAAQKLPEKIEISLIPYKPMIPLSYKDNRGYSYRPLKKKKFKKKNRF